MINAIIGQTASGKSTLALTLAKRFGLCVVSLDSLSVYKGVDIASAKPKKEDLSEVKHYGIDVLNPNEKCNAKIFLDILNEVCKIVPHDKILIVGGSSFYLKSIIDGLSFMPKSSKIVESFIDKFTQNKAESYKILCQIDATFAKKINPNDKFRIAKALQIYAITNEIPSVFFANNKKERFPFKINIYELVKPKECLKHDIIVRTEAMFEAGLVDEVENLYKNWEQSQVFKAIGIKEIIAFLKGDLSQSEAKEAIIKNTIALAKRQRTFNRTQFGDILHLEAQSLEQTLTHFYLAKTSKITAGSTNG